MIFEEQFPVPRYTAASKIGNSVISLLWQLRFHCNPDHNKFSSSSNTTVVTIFPKLCFWRRSLCSNLGGIDPEKLYRATLKKPRTIHSLIHSFIPFCPTHPFIRLFIYSIPSFILRSATHSFMYSFLIGMRIVLKTNWWKC